MRAQWIAAVAGWLVASGCGSGPAGPETPEGREDLYIQHYDAFIRNGLSDVIRVDVPRGADSMLIEVRGSEGLYYLTKFTTPTGSDLIEGAHFVTRYAREVPGLVDWMYPNDPTQQLMAGEYELVIRAETTSGNRVAAEDIDLTVYTVAEKSPETCGIHLDFLVDSYAIAVSGMEEAADHLASRMDDLYRQIGIKVIDYQIQAVDLFSPDVILGNRTAIDLVDDVIDQTRRSGGARDGSVHIVMVRSIGGEASGFNPAGYSMALPGPYNGDRGNAAVLVSAEAYANASGVLDLDGMASSLAHELGHFLGLYHTSEREGADHDPIPDTPECSSSFSCDDAFERNIMTSAFWLTGPPSKRTVLTPQQGVIVRRHPLCVPAEVDSGPGTCSLECSAPTTCGMLGGTPSCMIACDPFMDECPEPSRCLPDEIGTYVCMSA